MTSGTKTSLIIDVISARLPERGVPSEGGSEGLLSFQKVDSFGDDSGTLVGVHAATSLSPVNGAVHVGDLASGVGGWENEESSDLSVAV